MLISIPYITRRSTCKLDNPDNNGISWLAMQFNCEHKQIVNNEHLCTYRKYFSKTTTLSYEQVSKEIYHDFDTFISKILNHKSGLMLRIFPVLIKQ